MPVESTLIHRFGMFTSEQRAVGVLFRTAARPVLRYPRGMTTFHARSLAVTVCAVLFGVSQPASAQDLSRYRDIAFGSSVGTVATMTGTNMTQVKVVHQRPALIQEFVWRPQYGLGQSLGRSEAAREITFRFCDDELFSIVVVYDTRLVEGLTSADIIDAVSGVYGPATRTLPSQPPDAAPSGSINSSTAIARWQSIDHEFTLMREAYPATFRLIGASKRVAMVARAAEVEARRLDQQEAPRRLAEQAVADAERKSAAADKTRATNKGAFRP